MTGPRRAKSRPWRHKARRPGGLRCPILAMSAARNRPGLRRRRANPSRSRAARPVAPHPAASTENPSTAVDQQNRLPMATTPSTVRQPLCCGKEGAARERRGLAALRPRIARGRSEVVARAAANPARLRSAAIPRPARPSRQPPRW